MVEHMLQVRSPNKLLSNKLLKEAGVIVNV